MARGDQYVPVNTDAEPNAQQGNAYRLSRKPDGTYHLYRRGRYLSGIIESGDYGTQEDGVDISTGELKFQKGAGFGQKKGWEPQQLLSLSMRKNI